MATKFIVPLQKLIRDFNLEVVYLPEDAAGISISTPEVNRPGLQLSGFFDYFDHQRMQILGKSEFAFLDQFDEEERTRRVDAVVKAFAENGKIVEINAHSFECRPGSAENCRRIAESCKKYGVRVVCSSDAHFFTQIGNVGAAVEMLEEIGFPEELVMNADYGRFLALAREKSGRPLI